MSWRSRVLLAIALAGAGSSCSLPYALTCQPEVEAADCGPAAHAAVTELPAGIGRVIEAEVCSVDLAQLCGLHDRPADVILTMAGGSLIGVAVERLDDGAIAATAYWDEDGRIDR